MLVITKLSDTIQEILYLILVFFLLSVEANKMPAVPSVAMIAVAVVAAIVVVAIIISTFVFCRYFMLS